MPKPFCASRRQHDLRAQEPHQLAALDREAVGHRHHQRIALGGADHGQPDAGVAEVASTTVWPGLQPSVAFGLLDDAERQPVLDGAGRVEELGLDVDLDVSGASRLIADRRRVADVFSVTVPRRLERKNQRNGDPSSRPDIRIRLPATVEQVVKKAT
jgi:hypothetical protein